MILTPEILYSGVGYIENIENLDEVLSWQPKKEWIQEAPEIKAGWRYLPIEKVEFLLSRLFNLMSVYVTPYPSPTYVTVKVEIGFRSDKIIQVDGVASAEINKTQNVSMATALAESLAKKAACEHLGTIFGRSLNRKDIISTVSKKIDVEAESIIAEFEKAISKMTVAETKREAVSLINLYPYLKSKINSACSKRIVEIDG